MFITDLKFNFEDLVIFDLANNHQGCVDHGIAIIRAMGELAKKHSVRAALKFQFRQLGTLIHPAHFNKSENKHVSRFVATRLNGTEYDRLKSVVDETGMFSMATPFDEELVTVIVDMDIDILKIASCSAADWPLLEVMAASGKPIVCSTGGLELGQIDDLYSFFQHRGVDFALMHCVSIYPTPADKLQLNQIDLLRRRYPGVAIGWSTHEDPNCLGPVQIAVAKGATLFERHVGIETTELKLNNYSSTPSQIDQWLCAMKEARTMCGSRHRTIIPEEQAALRGLQRGIYAKEVIPAGTEISKDVVYFAIPLLPGQLESGKFKAGIRTLSEFEVDAAMDEKSVRLPPDPPDRLIKKAIHEVKAMLHEANIHLNTDFKIEYSHHYGIEKFREIGAVLIDIVNCDYCKKIIVQLPGQVHPQHYHKLKEETFQVLSGILNVVIEGRKRVLHAGDTCLVQPGMWHSFWTETGCIFEEISTKHFNDDLFYKDKKINAMSRSERKTIVNHWGRYELPERLREERGREEGRAA